VRYGGDRRATMTWLGGATGMTLWRRVAIAAGVAILLSVVTVVAWALLHANDMPSTFA
jgi:hypothetical protein